MTDISTADQRAINRAGAHAAAEIVLRPAQRFMYGVTDLQVARVMRALETGVEFTFLGGPGWLAPLGHPMNTPEWQRRLKRVVSEMIRTGLVRHYWDRQAPAHHLIPAPVHARNLDDRGVSACLFVGEDRGPMRARLVDDLLDVDCLACEVAIAQGHPRGL